MVEFDEIPLCPTLSKWFYKYWVKSCIVAHEMHHVSFDSRIVGFYWLLINKMSLEKLFFNKLFFFTEPVSMKILLIVPLSSNFRWFVRWRNLIYEMSFNGRLSITIFGGTLAFAKKILVFFTFGHFQGGISFKRFSKFVFCKIWLSSFDKQVEFQKQNYWRLSN